MWFKVSRGAQVALSTLFAFTTAAPVALPSHRRQQDAEINCFNIGTAITGDISELRSMVNFGCRYFIPQGRNQLGGEERQVMKLDLGHNIHLEFHLYGQGTVDQNLCRHIFYRIAESCNEGGGAFKGGKGRFGSIMADLDPQKNGSDFPPPPPPDQGPPPQNDPPPQNGPPPQNDPPPQQDNGNNGGGGPTQFANDMLNIHNSLRAKHGAPPLSWDDGLASKASIDTQRCTPGLEHTNAGQNLAGGMDGPTSVQAWYDEISLYDFGNPGYSDAVGHFTQVIWKGASKLGCAIEECRGVAYAPRVTCNYDVGNISNDDIWRENVRPLGG